MTGTSNNCVGVCPNSRDKSSLTNMTEVDRRMSELVASFGASPALFK